MFACLLAPGVCSQCVCVFTAVCVHLGWVKCRAQIPSMGHHTWPYVTSLSLSIAQLRFAHYQYITIWLFWIPVIQSCRMDTWHRSCNFAGVLAAVVSKILYIWDREEKEFLSIKAIKVLHFVSHTLECVVFYFVFYFFSKKQYHTFLPWFTEYTH